MLPRCQSLGSLPLRTSSERLPILLNVSHLSKLDDHKISGSYTGRNAQYFSEQRLRRRGPKYVYQFQWIRSRLFRFDVAFTSVGYFANARPNASIR